MENFSTVLWIVVIAAAMIFNVVSQSRKQAKKQARQAGDRHAGMAVMGSGCGAATGFKGGHSRPAGGAAGRGAGGNPDDGAVCRIRRCGPGGRFRAHCTPQRAQRRAKRPHDSHGASPRRV